jgi:peptidoglycan hydrolase CwlO-like protein
MFIMLVAVSTLCVGLIAIVIKQKISNNRCIEHIISQENTIEELMEYQEDADTQIAVLERNCETLSAMLDDEELSDVILCGDNIFKNILN